MKKILLLLWGGIMALTMNAAVDGVYYLLPNSYGWLGANVTNVYDNAMISATNPTLDISGSDVNNQLKWEKPWGDKANYSPERRAYEWFKDTYQGGTQKVLTYEDLKVGVPADAKVIWFNIDRNMTEAQFESLVPSAVVNALATFVQNGGNLFLSTYATLLVEKMGRIASDDHKVTLTAWSNAWTADNADWGLRIIDDTKNSAVFKEMASNEKQNMNGWDKYQLITGAHTDRNCLWHTNWRVVEEGAQLLGCWSNGGAEAGFGFVEFFPKNNVNNKDWRGTIITMGLAAYQWGYPANTDASESANGKIDNVKNLTKGILNYLKGSAYWKNGEAPRNGKVGESYVCTPLSDFQNYDIKLSSSNENVASFNGGTLTLHTPGTTTIKATYVGNGMESCKTEIVLENEITVTAPTFTWVAVPANAAVTEDKPAVEITVDNGMTVQYKSTDERVATVAADGKLTYRHAGTTQIYGYVTVGETTYESEKKSANVSGMTVNWTTAPAATAFVGEDMTIAAGPVYGSAVARFETTNCSYSDGKLHFDAVGKAKVKPYTEGFDGDRFDGEEKTITVSYKTNSDVENVITSDLSSTGYDGDQMKFMLLHPNMRGLDSLSYEVIGDNAANTRKVKDDQGATHLEFKAAGTYTIRVTVKATEAKSVAGETWEAGIYQYDKTVTFDYKNGAMQEVFDADLSGIGRNDNKFMLLHPNMRGMSISNYRSSDETVAFVKELTEDANTVKRMIFALPEREISVKFDVTVPEWSIYAAASEYKDQTRLVTFGSDNTNWPAGVDYTGYTYVRTASNLNVSTICLPYPSKVSETECVVCTTAKRLDDQDVMKSMVLIELTAQDGYYHLDAGCAYVYVPVKVGDIHFIATGNSEKDAKSGAVNGTFHSIEAMSGMYFLSNNTLYHYGAQSSGTVTIRPFKAHFNVEAMPVYTENANTPVRIIPIIGGGIATGVEETSAGKATKALVNGKLVIMRGARTYTINGAVLK